MAARHRGLNVVAGRNRSAGGAVWYAAVTSRNTGNRRGYPLMRTYVDRMIDTTGSGLLASVVEVA